MKDEIKEFPDISKSDNIDTTLIRGIVNITADMSTQTKLAMFQQRFWMSRGQWDYMIFDQRELEFEGDPHVNKNLNDMRSDTEEKLSDCVYNIAVEFIESQVENNVPQPTVVSKRKEFEDMAKVIEDAIKNDLLDTRINKWNDRNERTTYKHGFSAIEVSWNPDYKRGAYNGEIELLMRHPKQIIPQVGVWDIEKMDYIFIVASVTKQYILQRYGIDLTSHMELFPEVNYVGDMSYSNAQLEKVSEITCWYKDEDGDIGKFVYVLNTVLEDYPKYFYRRLDKCEKCDKVKKDFKKKKCSCGSDKFVKKLHEYETLSQDIVLNRTEKINDPLSGEEIEQNIIIKKGTKIRYYVPKEFPLKIRVNVPSDFGFGGVSDLDLIRPQYNAMKKILNNLTEKVIRSQHIIAKLRDTKINFSTLIYQVIDCEDISQLSSIKVLDLSADITQDLEALQYLYKSAQNVLGITDSFQGKPDPTAKSGIAKQIQVNQSGGRIASKQQNKFDFYKELFEMIFYFKLAFYDETRPYVSKDNNGNHKYFDFNKYDFLYYNEDSEEWEYNDDFLFTVDSGSGFLKNKDMVYQQVLQLFQMKALDQTQLWALLDNLNFPYAGMIKKQIQEQMEQQQAMMQQQQMMAMQQQQTPEGQPQAGNPFEGLTDGLSPEELDHLEQNPEHVLEMLKGGGQNND